MKRAWVAVACVAALLLACGLLWLWHPFAPLVLLGSLLVQLPIIATLTRRGLSASYVQRAAARYAQYLESGDAAEWLAAESAEMQSAGYRYWSGAGRALNALNRAEAATALGFCDEAAQALADAEAAKLPAHEAQRFETVVLALRACTQARSDEQNE